MCLKTDVNAAAKTLEETGNTSLIDASVNGQEIKSLSTDNLAADKIKTDTEHLQSVWSLIFYKLHSHCTTPLNSINTS